MNQIGDILNFEDNMFIKKNIKICIDICRIKHFRVKIYTIRKFRINYCKKFKKYYSIKLYQMENFLIEL